MAQELGLVTLDKGKHEKARGPEEPGMLPNAQKLAQWRTEWVGKG